MALNAYTQRLLLSTDQLNESEKDNHKLYLLHVSQTLYVVKIDEEVKNKCVTPNCCDVTCVCVFVAKLSSPVFSIPCRFPSAMG